MENQCPYRQTDKECRFTKDIHTYTYCQCCLRGQTVDAIELNTSAIMGLSVDKLEDKISGT